MRIILFLLASALLSTAIAEVAAGGDDDGLLSLISGRSEKLTRVTGKPHVMAPVVASLCANMSADSTDLLAQSAKSQASPHKGKYFHVYMTDSGVGIIKNGKGVYPEGTVIVKEKFSDSTAKTTELFTVMVKRQKGFNPDGGDWEYFVISGDAKKITQRGKIESCMNCHDSYQDSDYVTRNYLSNTAP